MSGFGKPIFNYPIERRAPEGEGCPTCGITLEGDAVLGFCSPECAEYEDRCEGCQRGPTWCDCEQPFQLDENKMQINALINRSTNQVSLVLLKGTNVTDLDFNIDEARAIHEALGKCIIEFDN